MQVGSFVQSISRWSYDDVRLFVRLTGDDNDIHKDIVHGMLSASEFSKLLWELFDDGVILLGIDLKFFNPIKIDQIVQHKAVIKHIREDKPIYTVKLLCVSANAENKHIEGEAVIKWSV